MMTSTSTKGLGAIDYVSLVGLLVTSTSIGLYFAFRDRNAISTKNYFFGGKKMNPVAVGLSLAVTFRSSVSIVASPTEAYISGSLVLWALVTDILVVPIAMFYFIPVYQRLQLNTIYEYLELRFCVGLRKLAAGMLTLGTIFYMGTVVYLPAVTLNAVTPLEMKWSILLTGIICTLYTGLGGMKGVIWTDVLQSAIMIAGVFAVFFRGLDEAGGFGNMVAAMERGGRFTANRFDFGLISRLSPIAVILGGFVYSLDSVCFSQAIVQRYQSCETPRYAQYALLVYILPTILLSLTTFGNGFVMYAFYEGCDPVQSGIIENIDQGVAYMALEIFQSIPGLTGLFISTIFSATLSTVSSCLNSLSAVILQDFIVAWRPSLTERMRVLVGKILVAILGSLVVCMSFAIASAESSGLELLYGFLGLIYGPLAGIYILGFFMPWSNKIGAICGMISGYAILAFMFIGKNFFNHPPYHSNVPGVSTAHCPANVSETPQNLTTIIDATTAMPGRDGDQDLDQRTALRDIFNINFNLFMFVGFITSITIGIATSFMSGHTPAEKADPNLFIPLIDNERFPESVRKFFRFGVRNIKEAGKVGLTDAKKEKEDADLLHPKHRHNKEDFIEDLYEDKVSNDQV